MLSGDSGFFNGGRWSCSLCYKASGDVYCRVCNERAYVITQTGATSYHGYRTGGVWEVDIGKRLRGLNLYADEETVKALRTIDWFVDCGDDDFLLDTNTRFFREMKKAEVPCELRVRDGDHDWKYWSSALSIALPFVSNSFKK